MSPVRQEVSRLVALAVPVVATQVGLMLLGLVDLAMVKELGSAAVAAAALGETLVFGTWIVATGVIQGIDPMVSQAHGARRGEEAGRALQSGIWLSALLGLPLFAVWWFAGPILEAFGTDPARAADAQTYCRWQAFSGGPFLAFAALRAYLQNRAIVRPILAVVVAANFVNWALNRVLIFGALGLPPLGLAGAGLATGLARLFLLGALAGVVVFGRLHAGAWTPWSRRAVEPAALARVLRVGIPVGLQWGLEVWAFSGALLLAERLGVAAVAAHTVAIKYASLSFMVPLGLSIAAAARVGNLIGAGDRPGAQRAAWVALALSAGFMACAAVVFVAFRDALPRRFSNDAEVVALAASVLPIAAAFQLFDGTQVVGGGILRGMGDARPAAAFNFLGYYVIALPLALFWTRGLGGGLHAIWWSLCLGLGVVAALLLARIALRGP